MAPRNPYVVAAKASGAVACEKEEVLVGREGGSIFCTARVDYWSKVLRWSPAIVDTGALADPDVLTADSGRTVGNKVKAQPVPGDRRVLVNYRRIDRRAKVVDVDWRAPV